MSRPVADIAKAVEAVYKATGELPNRFPVCPVQIVPEGWPKRKKYSVVLADPPWSYRDKANSGKRGVVHKYDTMSLDQLKGIGNALNAIMEPTSALFMWVTAPMMRDAYILMDMWEMKVSTIAFVWVKGYIYVEVKDDEKVGDVRHILHWGMGNSTRANAEFVLLAHPKKGKLPKRASASVHQIIFEPRREHSRKPDIYDRIDALYPEGKRIELFARQRVRGWDAWGNQVGQFKRA